MALRKSVLAGGLGLLAATAIAASQAKPLEAPVPEHGVPAAQHVETVLRATYVLPTGRGESFATFLKQNAAAGIDVHFEHEQLVVVAPADAQKALGRFIEKCIKREPGSEAAPTYFHFAPDVKPQNNAIVPEYEDPNDGFGPSTPKVLPTLPNDGFGSQPNDAAFGPATRIQQKAPED